MVKTGAAGSTRSPGPTWRIVTVPLIGESSVTVGKYLALVAQHLDFRVGHPHQRQDLRAFVEPRFGERRLGLRDAQIALGQRLAFEQQLASLQPVDRQRIVGNRGEKLALRLDDRRRTQPRDRLAGLAPAHRRRPAFPRSGRRRTRRPRGSAAAGLRPCPVSDRSVPPRSRSTGTVAMPAARMPRSSIGIAISEEGFAVAGSGSSAREWGRAKTSRRLKISQTAEGDIRASPTPIRSNRRPSRMAFSIHPNLPPQ